MHTSWCCMPQRHWFQKTQCGTTGCFRWSRNVNVAWSCRASVPRGGRGKGDMGARKRCMRWPCWHLRHGVAMLALAWRGHAGVDVTCGGHARVPRTVTVQALQGVAKQARCGVATQIWFQKGHASGANAHVIVGMVEAVMQTCHMLPCERCDTSCQRCKKRPTQGQCTCGEWVDTQMWGGG